jgi:predicted HicB family RNase H-like nuclease
MSENDDEKTETLSLRIPESVKRVLRDKAEQREESLSQYIRVLIYMGLCQRVKALKAKELKEAIAASSQ